MSHVIPHLACQNHVLASLAKRCGWCDKVKSKFDFHRSSIEPGGFDWQCKSCFAIDESTWGDSHEESKRSALERLKAKTQYGKGRAMALGSIPRWANQSEMKRLYAEARRKTLETGVLWVVDHIVPLKAKSKCGKYEACGLHCPSNMQIITQQENDSKRNYYWPQMGPGDV